MIKLEHVNLWVGDMEKTLAFYQAAFPHWNIRTQGTADWYGHPRTWLHFGDDYTYLAFNDSAVGENRDLEGHTRGLAHIAFAVDNLDAITARLESAGYPVFKPGADHAHRRNIYFLDPDGYEVEFVEYLSDLPIERNSDE